MEREREGNGRQRNGMETDSGLETHLEPRYVFFTSLIYIYCLTTTGTTSTTTSTTVAGAGIVLRLYPSLAANASRRVLFSTQLHMPPPSLQMRAGGVFCLFDYTHHLSLAASASWRDTFSSQLHTPPASLAANASRRGFLVCFFIMFF